MINSSRRLVYHCSLVSDWRAAQQEGIYTMSSRGRTLEQEGFVHASDAGQVAGVLARFYADLTEPLCLLTIDPDLLDVPLVRENLIGGTELFPHIYGPVPTAAVIGVVELTRTADGWRWPDAPALSETDQ